MTPALRDRAQELVYRDNERSDQVNLDDYTADLIDPVTMAPMFECIELTDCGHLFSIRTVIELLVRDKGIKCPLCRKKIDRNQGGWRKFRKDISDKCVDIYNRCIGTKKPSEPIGIKPKFIRKAKYG